MILDGLLRLRLTAILAVVLVALVVTEPAAAQTDQSELDGLTVVRVVCRRFDIFDTSQPKTSSWPYRAANALHITTAERFIRSMLLFSEGEPYSQHDAEESARILRSLKFLNPVEITARPVDGGVEVVVETHDQWTLEVGAQAGLWGDRSEHSFEFTEQNFLGWGQQVTIEYESAENQNSLTYAFYDPNLFRRHLRARVAHENRSHGFSDLWRLEYPFYSLATKRAWGVQWLQDKDREFLYSGAKIRVLGTRDSEGYRLWGGLRLPGGGDVTRRLMLGWEKQDDSFYGWQLYPSAIPYPDPEDREIAGPHVGYQRVVDRYQVVTGFRAWSKQEDIALGPNLDLGVTVSLPAFGGDRDRLLVNGSAEGAQLREDWLLMATGWFSGRLEEGDLHNFSIGAQVAAAQLGRRGWQARLLAETLVQPDRDRQLTLGAENGLRGWDPDYFDGTGRALANVQWRTLVKEEIGHFVTLGLVLFADAGYVWGDSVGEKMERVHADVGVGLLADLTRLGSRRLLRCDVAVPDDGSGYVVTVTTSALF